MFRIRKPNLSNSALKSPSSSLFSLRTRILLFTGLILLLIPLAFYVNQTIQLMYVVPEVPTKTQSQEARVYPKPVEIFIPAVHLSQLIHETTIQNNSWQISRFGISHLAVSASPGENGPIILYGHNTKNTFGPIRWLNKGDEIILKTDDAALHAYRIVETVKTDPKELSVFFKREDEALYLFTCDGFADLKRYIVIAEPIASSSAQVTNL